MIDEFRPVTDENIELAEARISIYRAIAAGLDRWPEVADLAYRSATADSMISGLQDLLGIDEVQAHAVADMQVRRVAEGERSRIHEHLQELERDVAEMRKHVKT